jgi:signal peptidase I
MKKPALTALTALAAVVAAAFFVRPMRIEGDSMLPTYRPGDLVLTLPAWGKPKQGDIVVFLPPLAIESATNALDPTSTNGQLDPDQPLIKRIAGTPGQSSNTAHNAESKLTGDGTAAGGPAVSPATHRVTWGLAGHPAVGLPDDHYFLIGDNPSSSVDSRQFGSVPRDRIQRRVVGRIWSTSP